MSVVAVVAAVCFGAVAEIAELSRERAASSAKTDTEPLLAQAVNLYGSLSEANATATTTFLVGGLEPPARRARYLADIAAASESLAVLTREVGNSPLARDAVATVARGLPTYTGLVESARANNRQAFPVGAAYMRQASTLLDTTILPAARRLYTTEAERLRDDYDTGTSSPWLVAFAVAILALIAMLVYAQWSLARISNRIFNVPMVAATVLLVALGAWGVTAMTREQDALASAQRNGSDSVEVLSAARILVSRAQSDESLTLIARGGDTTDPADFDAVIALLGQPNGSGGLVGEVDALAQRAGTAAVAGRFNSDLEAYLAQHTQINALVQQGQTSAANNLASGLTSTGPSPVDHLTADLVGQVAAAQSRFERAASDATSALNGLSLAIPLVIVIATVLTLIGFRLRGIEYR